MARRVKDKYMGARVDDDTFARVLEYIEAQHLTQGDLVRAAVEEYIINHPVKLIERPKGV